MLIKDPKYKNVNSHTMVILDDVISDKKVRKDDLVDSLFTEGRHYNLFIGITTQAAKEINPTLRSNTDVAFIFYMVAQSQKESVYEDYFSFMKKDMFYALFDKYTANNMCLVVVNTNGGGNPWDNIYWAKAEDPGEFKMGCEEMWKPKQAVNNF